MIAKYITEDMLKRVAAAFDDNRMLFVGTTNIDYGQTWVWNMTMIAKTDELALYRDVLLAFDQTPMRVAFAAGEALGAQDSPWLVKPTNTGDMPDWVFKDMVPAPATAPAP